MGRRVPLTSSHPSTSASPHARPRHMQPSEVASLLTLCSLPHSCHPRLLSSLHPPIPALPSGIGPHPNVHLSSDFRDVSLFLPPTPDMKSERMRHQSLSLHPIRPPPLRRSHRRALSPPTPTRLRWRGEQASRPRNVECSPVTPGRVGSLAITAYPLHTVSR